MNIKKNHNGRKVMENIGGIRIKTPVPRLLMNLGCRKRYQMNAVAIYYHSEI